MTLEELHRDLEATKTDMAVMLEEVHMLRTDYESLRHEIESLHAVRTLPGTRLVRRESKEDAEFRALGMKLSDGELRKALAGVEEELAKLRPAITALGRKAQKASTKKRVPLFRELAELHTARTELGTRKAILRQCLQEKVAGAESL